MKKNLNILFVAAEVAPFSKAGGLADVAGALPGALKHLDCNTTIMTPLYGFMDKKSLNLSRPEYSTEITFADEPNRADYYFVMHNGIDILFLENESFYQRDGIYTDSNGQGYEDNFGRFLFLQKAALAVLEKRLIVPDVVHVNDHHTALLPWMMKNRRLGIPSLLTIHNSMYQGEFSTDDVLLLDEREQIKLSETKQTLNSLDIGLHHADAVNTVSKTYREELLEKPELSYGLYKTYIHISERFHRNFKWCRLCHLESGNRYQKSKKTIALIPLRINNRINWICLNRLGCQRHRALPSLDPYPGRLPAKDFS